MTLALEELLLLKLWQFVGYEQQDDESVGLKEDEDECHDASPRFLCHFHCHFPTGFSFPSFC